MKGFNMTDKTITIEVKQVYGNTLYYPVCDTAKLFRDIGKAKTILTEDIDKIKKLGFSIQVKQPIL